MESAEVEQEVGEYDKAVVFVDLLGFSVLTESQCIQPEVFDALHNPGAIQFLRASLEEMNANALSEAFIRFHLLVEQNARQLRLTADCTVVSFSDCAFIATDNIWSAASFARTIMQAALQQKIPLRLGIGHGEFHVVRIRADFGSTNQDHVVQFLGSGVSRAFAAEHCGVKGFRILIHPSAERRFSTELTPFNKDWGHFRLVPVADSETNSTGVSRELCYLSYKGDDRPYWNILRDLTEKAPAAAMAHYMATKAALNRMRSALGRESFE